MKKTIKDLELKGKKLIVRVDFNVPLDENGQITDDTRITATLPTIKYILDQGGRLVLCSHLGRPKGAPDPKFSLNPVAKRLSELLGQEVPMLPDCVGDAVKEATLQLEDGQACLLENVRFHPGETKNDPEQSKRLAELGAERYIPSIVPTVGLVLLGGMENGLLTYALAPEVVHAAARQQVRHQDKLDEYYIRPGSAGVMFDNDMAGTRGPLISPEMFRRMVLPYFEHRARRVKTFRDQLILHNCGNNVPLMEMFIEAGVDCYQSLQTGAGMEVGRLKELFGDRLCFWGGVAVEVLIDGEPEDVRREVRTAMERGAPGGGFILGPSHSVAKNTKYDNFMAMLDEFVKLRDKF